MTQHHSKFILAANWKMNKTAAEATSFAEELSEAYGKQTDVNIALCAPYTSLHALSPILGESNISLGAQNMHPESSGAYTGEVSPTMLRELFVNYVIVGHSERRTLFNESNHFINEKIHSAFNSTLKPILCIGETLEERQSGKALDTVAHQLESGLKDLKADQISSLVIAYEPIWAIGTGKSATPEMSQVMHASIRNLMESMFGKPGTKVPVLYGGSLKPDNAEALLSQPDINGGLIGGAALSLKSFKEIIKIALKLSEPVPSRAS